MKKVFLVFALFFLHNFTYAQLQLEAKATSPGLSSYTGEMLVIYRKPKPIDRNSIYFELAGSGGFGSFNFEWRVNTNTKNRWMLRAGISGTYIDKNNGSGIIFPLMAHYVIGRKHGLDLGIGQALTITTRGSVFLRAPLSIGYRLEPENSRMFYRFSYTPLISYIVDFQWQHWGGITVGYKLKPKYK